MRYGPKTLQHYLQVFAERIGVRDVDVNSEIAELCRDFEATFDAQLQRIEQLERRVSALSVRIRAIGDRDD